jgi:hypothetical protein
MGGLHQASLAEQLADQLLPSDTTGNADSYWTGLSVDSVPSHEQHDKHNDGDDNDRSESDKHDDSFELLRRPDVRGASLTLPSATC